jgi:2-pyrone-4,6-dicarboxylate lactonase
LLKTLESNHNNPLLCQAPDQVLKKPGLVLCEHATDCHAHICGPASVYPYSPKRIYTPPDALLPQYQTLLQSIGIERAVLVQPSIYADDNRALLAALKTDLLNLRGVAVVDWDISERDLEKMHHAGVRGVRCNIVDLADAKGVLPILKLRYLADKIAPFGWHLEFLMHVNEFPELDQTLRNFPVPVVLGHLGYLKTSLGVNDPGFQGLLSLMREERAWVKLTGPTESLRKIVRPIPTPIHLLRPYCGPIQIRLFGEATGLMSWSKDLCPMTLIYSIYLALGFRSHNCASRY